MYYCLQIFSQAGGSGTQMGTVCIDGRSLPFTVTRWLLRKEFSRNKLFSEQCIAKTERGVPNEKAPRPLYLTK